MHRLRRLTLTFIFTAASACTGPGLAHAFNPVKDVLENTRWTLGSAAQAGTAWNL